METLVLDGCNRKNENKRQIPNGFETEHLTGEEVNWIAQNDNPEMAQHAVNS